jgi:heme/copper-type cytochrome/quinol oxidase subunit 2
MKNPYRNSTATKTAIAFAWIAVLVFGAVMEWYNWPYRWPYRDMQEWQWWDWLWTLMLLIAISVSIVWRLSRWAERAATRPQESSAPHHE